MEWVHVHNGGGDQLQSAIQYIPITCGHCGRDVHARLIAVHRTGATAKAAFALCDCGSATGLRVKGSSVMGQWPASRDYHANEDWPNDLARLFDEAAAAYAAGAFTSTAMVCRKVLMVAAHREGADEDLRFIEYVDYLAEEVLPIRGVRETIDEIRNIGNDANHEIEFVSVERAARSLEISQYLLDAMHALPAPPDEAGDEEG